MAAEGDTLLKDATSLETLAHAPSLEETDVGDVALGVVVPPVRGIVLVATPVGLYPVAETDGYGLFHEACGCGGI